MLSDIDILWLFQFMDFSYFRLFSVEIKFLVYSHSDFGMV